MKDVHKGSFESFPYFFVGTFIEVFLLHSTGWVFLRFLAETFIEVLRSVILGVLTALHFPSLLAGLLIRQINIPSR